jgi:hypothetical protein
MGWASGSILAERIWKEIIEIYTPVDDWPIVAIKLVDFFEDADCDTLEECTFVQKYLEWDDEREIWKLK